ncbi:MAG: hypothetical protein EOP00_18815, partial [Pedobacter sp.]
MLPIEFISRLYERFVTSSEDEKQKGTGAFYTPPHLARLLVDELLPFDSNIDFNNFKILDPSCGSGIFLVLAYKRLITLWMLANNKQKIEGRNDIEAIKSLLSNSIYGVDINEDALSITATSLQIELTSHIQPKDIWDKLVYDNLTNQDNLSNSGFFKWYRFQQKSFNIIVGNPPFKISEKENEANIKSGKDLDFRAERYVNDKNKSVPFPQNNPALSILYNLLTHCLKDDGTLLLILPATATIYNSNSTSRAYLKTVLTKWDVTKIYDFTPLRDSLWNGAKVATVALLVSQPKKSDRNLIQHIVIKNTNINKQGSVRFQIDKYDSFNVSVLDAIQKPYIWKSNLLGGGRISFVIEKYQNKKLFTPIAELPQVKNNEWLIQDGAKSSSKEGKELGEQQLPLLLSKQVKGDTLDRTVFDESPSGLYRLDNENLYIPPNLLIKCNVNQGIPTIYNTEKAFIFDNSFLGIKSYNDNQDLSTLTEVFKASRKLYKFLITTTSSKTFLQKGGNSIINSNDIKRLPVVADHLGNITPFETSNEIEDAIIEDTELMAKSLNNTHGPLFNKVTNNDIEQFCKAFAQILNYVYEDENNKFNPSRQIINDDFIWVSFQHSDKNLLSVEKVLDKKNETILQRIIKDEDTNKG